MYTREQQTYNMVDEARKPLIAQYFANQFKKKYRQENTDVTAKIAEDIQAMVSSDLEYYYIHNQSKNKQLCNTNIFIDTELTPGTFIANYFAEIERRMCARQLIAYARLNNELTTSSQQEALVLKAIFKKMLKKNGQKYTDEILKELVSSSAADNQQKKNTLQLIIKPTLNEAEQVKTIVERINTTLFTQLQSIVTAEETRAKRSMNDFTTTYQDFCTAYVTKSTAKNQADQLNIELFNTKLQSLNNASQPEKQKLEACQRVFKCRQLASRFREEQTKIGKAKTILDLKRKVTNLEKTLPTAISQMLPEKNEQGLAKKLLDAFKFFVLGEWLDKLLDDLEHKYKCKTVTLETVNAAAKQNNESNQQEKPADALRSSLIGCNSSLFFSAARNSIRAAEKELAAKSQSIMSAAATRQ